MRILVVEDEPTLAEQLAQAIAAAGHTVERAADGREACFLGEEQDFDAVVLDLGLPLLDGLSVLRRWRAAGRTMPVLILTARSSWQEKVAGMDAGADDYLAKPFRRDELLMAVRRIVETAKFEKTRIEPDMDEALTCLANPIRRRILALLTEKGEMRFMDITRSLDISDHTKVGFHLKNLKAAALIDQNREKSYRLTAQGKKIHDCLHLLAKQISS